MAKQEMDRTGIVVGHWYVAGDHGTSNKRGAKLYQCISHCGVASPFTGSALAVGASQTCEACRPRGVSRIAARIALNNFVQGSGPAPFRVLSEEELVAHQSRWNRENIVHVNHGALKGDGIEDFEVSCRDLLIDLLERTELGLDFGWSLFVQGCHDYTHGPPKYPFIRLGQIDTGIRRINLKVRPTDSRYHYEIAVNVARTGNFQDVVARITRAIATINSASENPPTANAKPAVAAPVAAPAATTVEPVKPVKPSYPAVVPVSPTSVTHLETVRGDLEALISVTREIEQGREMRAEVEKRLSDAKAKAQPLLNKLSDVNTRVDLAAKRKTEAVATIASLREELALAEAELVQAEAEHAAVADLQADLALEATPATLELESAKHDMTELVKLEEERDRKLKTTGNLAAILAALNNANKPS